MANSSFGEIRLGRRPPVDARAAGEYTGLSAWTIRKKAYAGELSSLKIGSRLLFDLDELDVYLAEHTRPRRIVRPTPRDGSNEARQTQL
jgi:excisionase family DNA binding protein